MRSLALLLTLVASIASADPLPERFDAGWTVVDATLQSPKTPGWRCKGVGESGPQAREYELSAYAKTASLLRWTRQEPGAWAIEARGAHFVLSDLALCGLSGSPSSVGIRVRHRGAFNGAKGSIDRVSIRGFAAAIVVGEEGRPGNDNLHVDRVAIARCGAGLVVRGMQSMSHSLDRVTIRASGPLVLVEGGGRVHVDHVDIGSGGTLLRIDASGQQTGSTNGRFVMENVVVDGPRGTTTLVHQTDPTATAHVTIAGIEFNGPGKDGPKAVASLTGPHALLIIRDGRNLPADTRLTLTGGATAIVENCQLRCHPRDLLSDESAKCRLVVRNCWWGSGERRNVYRDVEFVR